MIHELYTWYSIRFSKIFSFWNRLVVSLDSGKTRYSREILYAEMPAKFDRTGKAQKTKLNRWTVPVRNP